MKKTIYYLARTLAVLITGFFSLFIFEGFGSGFGWRDSLAHAIIPLFLLAAIITAWRRPKMGGWIWLFVGLLFTIFFRPFWINGLVIGICPLLSGLLFLVEGYRNEV